MRRVTKLMHLSVGQGTTRLPRKALNLFITFNIYRSCMKYIYVYIKYNFESIYINIKIHIRIYTKCLNKTHNICVFMYGEYVRINTRKIKSEVSHHSTAACALNSRCICTMSLGTTIYGIDDVANDCWYSNCYSLLPMVAWIIKLRPLDCFLTAWIL